MLLIIQKLLIQEKVKRISVIKGNIKSIIQVKIVEIIPL